MNDEKMELMMQALIQLQQAVQQLLDQFRELAERVSRLEGT